MKIKLKLIQISCLMALLSGCGQGNSNGSNATPHAAPKGPVSYQKIYDAFNPNAKSTQASLASKSLQSGGGCGLIMGDSATGGVIASGFLSFIPEAGPALGVITGVASTIVGFLGGANASSCVQQEFQSIENQLAIQQSEINNIESSLQLSSNNIWTQIAGMSGNTLATNYNNFTKSVGSITGKDGIFENIYSAAGFYNSDAGSEQLSSQTLAQLESNNINLTAAATVYSNAVITDLASTIGNISGATYSSCPNDANGYPACYQTVVADTNSELILLLNSAHTYLQTELSSQFNNGTNLVPLLDDYNNTIMAYYQQSLSAIQSAYHLAYLANYLNYQTQSVTGSGTVMANLFAIPGTYYESGVSMGGPANATAAQNYNEAQQNLTLMTAALINQLYTNVAGYIVTDVPIGNQSYPNTQQIYYYNSNGVLTVGESINYSGLVGASLGQNSTATQTLLYSMQQAQIGQSNSYNALVANLNNLGGYNSTTGSSPNLFFYQYGGLNNIASCISSIESYNQQYGTSGNIESALSSGGCPSIFSDVNGSQVNQSVLSNATAQPYYTSNGLPTLTGAVTGNISTTACNGSTVGSVAAWNMYYYTPKSNYPSLGTPGTPYLMCGNWQTTGIENKMSSTYGSGAGIMIPYGSYANPYAYAQMQQSVNDPNYGTPILFNQETLVMGQDSTSYWSTSSNPSQGNLTNGTIYPGVLSGWINDNWPQNFDAGYQLLHTIALQSVLPDGFIAPYAVSIGNLSGAQINMGSDHQNGFFTIGVAPNPNIIQAGVTINNQPLYNTSAIGFNNMPYNSVQSMVQNYPWTPVISNLPAMTGAGNAANTSVLGINGYLLGIYGNINENQYLCFLDSSVILWTTGLATEIGLAVGNATLYGPANVNFENCYPGNYY